jgi:hypothetical protein
MDIYYKSDFTLIEAFLDENGVAIDMTAIDFKIDYYTLSNIKYTASKTGAVYVNCEAGSTTNQLNVFFAKHGMPAGKLQREITLYVTNPDFSPNQKVITNPVSDIILVAKGGDSATASASVVYPAIVVPPTYYDIKDLTDSTGLRASWTAKIGIEDLQDATTKDAIIDADEFNYLDSANKFSLVKTTWLNIIAKLLAVFNLEYEPKKSTGENYVSDEELEVLQNTSGENTGDETAESIIGKIGTDGQIKSDYLPSYVDDVIEGYYFEASFYSDSEHTELITAEQGKIYVDIPTNFSYRYSGSAYINISNPLDYSTDIETDKASTTKVSAIKTFYDWAVGKFIDLSKLVTTWTATTLDTNIPSEKLVKDSLNLKADITPANGSTSALRALFIARGYYKEKNTYYCVYNANTGYYEMNGLTDLTEAQMADIYINTAVQINIGIGVATSFTCMSYSNIRTSFPRTTMSGYDSTNDINRFRGCDKLEVYKNYQSFGHFSLCCTCMFYGCSKLHTVDFINLTLITNAAYLVGCFTECVKLVTANVKNLKVSFSFKDCPLLSLASLQYLVTNRGNGTTRITITVHPTVWGYLNDAVGHPTWNALLVDAVNNQCINFASA